MTRAEATRQMSREVHEGLVRLLETEDVDLVLIVVSGGAYSTSSSIPPARLAELLDSAAKIARTTEPIVETTERPKKDSVN